MANQIEVILGTYEGFLVGYKVGYNKKGDEVLIQSFSDNNHNGSVKCIATSGKYIASGGVDERIYVYDMLQRREIQILTHHQGTVNTLMFTPEATHLFSGSDDGKMCAVRVGNWQIQATWKKAHGGLPVYSISSHPSGKLALTVGKDLTLRTWNLIKGRIAYVKNLKSMSELEHHADCIAWSPDGNYFSITGYRVLEIWSIDNPGMVIQEKCESKPTCACWVDNTAIFGLENGKLLLATVTDEKSSAEIVLLKAYEDQRVKCINYINDVLATVSSSGEICLWKFDQLRKEIDKVCSVNIGCRPTCMGLLDLTQFDDNYILKQEDKEEEKVFEKNNSPVKKNENDKEKTDNRGRVVVEYEDEELRTINETISPSKNEETNNLSENDVFTGQAKKTGRKKKKGNKNANKNLLNNEDESEKIPLSDNITSKDKDLNISINEITEENVESITSKDDGKVNRTENVSKKKRKPNDNDKSAENSLKKKKKRSTNWLESTTEIIEDMKVETHSEEISKLNKKEKNKEIGRKKKKHSVTDDPENCDESHIGVKSLRRFKNEDVIDRKITRIRNTTEKKSSPFKMKTNPEKKKKGRKNNCT